jgi:hypothetical protein
LAGVISLSEALFGGLHHLFAVYYHLMGVSVKSHAEVCNSVAESAVNVKVPEVSSMASVRVGYSYCKTIIEKPVRLVGGYRTWKNSIPLVTKGCLLCQRGSQVTRTFEERDNLLILGKNDGFAPWNDQNGQGYET